MKVVKTTMVTYVDIKKKVDNEIRMLKNNAHKNIIQFIDIFEKEVGL